MNGSRKRWNLGAVLAALAVFSLVGLGIQDAKGDPPSRKHMREARVFERVMDDMLIDSRNFLVPGRENTRAYHVPGHGLIVTFEATLVDRDGRGISIWHWGDDRDLRRGLRWNDDYDDEDDYDEDSRDDSKKRRSRRERSSDREERLYERGKQEIKDVLMDYGDSFEALSSGEVIEVVVFLGDADYFYDKDIDRLVVRAKIEDLRAYGQDQLSEEALQSRFQIEEY